MNAISVGVAVSSPAPLLARECSRCNREETTVGNRKRNYSRISRTIQGTCRQGKEGMHSPTPGDHVIDGVYMQMAEVIAEMKKSFYCQLCDKQYNNYKEYDNHINSYSHAHNQRLKQLKEYEIGRRFGGCDWLIMGVVFN